MVNIPGSSRRCNECRRRRVRCGLERPSCSRCVKAGVRCSGPRDGPTFVRRDCTNIHGNSDRKILVAAIRNETSPPDQRRRPSSVPNQGGALVQTQVTPPPTSQLYSAQDFYQSMVEDFRTAIFEINKKPSREALQSAVSICSSVVIPMAFQNKALDTTIFAAFTMYMARLRGDSKMLELAMSSYPTALRYFRPQINLVLDKRTERRNLTDMLMAISIGLQLFEWLAGLGPLEEAYYSHVNGALDIIKLSGPEAFQTPTSRHIFSGVRSVFLPISLSKRKATFLAETLWTSIPYQSSTKTLRELLLDLHLQIPGLLERADQIMAIGFAEGDGSTERKDRFDYSLEVRQCRQYLEFLRDCDALIRDIDSWFETLQKSEQRPLWWYSGTPHVTGSPQVDPNQQAEEGVIPVAQQVSGVNFASHKVAGILVVYWTGLLELSTSVLDIRKLLKGNALHATSSQHLGPDSPSLAMPESRPSKLALRICQAAMYLSPFLEGCTISFGHVVLAANYFKRQLAAAELDSSEQFGSEGITKSERARIGLEYSQKAIGMILKTMRYGQRAELS